MNCVPRRAPESQDKEWLEACVCAIQNGCRAAKGQRNVKGYLYYYNDDGYGLDGGIAPCLPQKITNADLRNDARGTRYGVGKSSLYIRSSVYLFRVSADFERLLRAEIAKMGFTDYTLILRPLEDETQIIDYGVFGRTVRYEKNGKVGKSIYVELRW